MGAARFPCARDPQASRSLPLSAAINLHEIHLERQSLLQVPVGHIPVPGGIKLCSPGTFLVANYLIINNGSCQVNFTKPISATIRCTNSQWLRDAATEASVGMVAVPKTGQKTPSPRGDGTEVPVGMVLVPKTCQKTPSFRSYSRPSARSSSRPSFRSSPAPPGHPSRPALPSSRATLFFGKEADGWTRNFINFLILEKEGQTRFLQ